jgi:hypothetical protein
MEEELSHEKEVTERPLKDFPFPQRRSPFEFGFPTSGSRNRHSGPHNCLISYLLPASSTTSSMNKRTASFDKPRSSRKSRLSSPSGGSSSPRSDRGSSSSRVGLTISRSYGPGSGTEGDDEGQDELSASDLFAFDDGFVGSDAGATAGAGEAQSSRIGLPAFLTMSLDSSTPDYPFAQARRSNGRDGSRVRPSVISQNLSRASPHRSLHQQRLFLLLQPRSLRVRRPSLQA